MPGREDAQNFINTPPEREEFREEIVLTLHCILDESERRGSPYVPTAVILNYLADQGYEMTVTQWQQNVLGRLRNMPRRGVFIGASSKGMFLIENEFLAIEAVEFYRRRIASEERRLESLRDVFELYGYPFPD